MELDWVSKIYINPHLLVPIKNNDLRGSFKS